MEALTISNKSVSWDYLSCLISSPSCLRISPQTKKLIKNSNDALQAILKKGQLIYGVNTGFGKLSSVSIDQSEIKQLQLNLVRSHAAGIGNPFNIGIVRVAMALKILTWSKGYSGVRPKLVNQLIAMLNKDIIPLIPSLGSVGASGDLAPLSHLACAMIGEGDVMYKGTVSYSKKALH